MATFGRKTFDVKVGSKVLKAELVRMPIDYANRPTVRREVHLEEHQSNTAAIARNLQTGLMYLGAIAVALTAATWASFTIHDLFSNLANMLGAL